MSDEKIINEIKVGDKLPSLVLQEGIGEYKTVEVNIADLIAKKKVVVFGVPGAFTPGCSKSHVPSFITAYDELLSKGIDMIICIATNDAYVMEVCMYYCVCKDVCYYLIE
jgi:2-Cys peroxiredoxin 5